MSLIFGYTNDTRHGSTSVEARGATDALAPPRFGAVTPLPSCRHTAPDGRVFDLSAWANTTLVAAGDKHSSFNLSLCENLPTVCHDSLTGAAMPPGAVFSLFAGQPAGTCWDVLAHWSDRLAPTFASDGLALRFSHAFDAHLGCFGTNVTVEVQIVCDRAAREPVAAGRQTGGCAWRLLVRTADRGRVVVADRIDGRRADGRVGGSDGIGPGRFSNVAPRRSATDGSIIARRQLFAVGG